MTAFTPKNMQVWIADAEGNFVPVYPETMPMRARELEERWQAGDWIRCELVPSADGIRYAQDWSDLTHFG